MSKRLLSLDAFRGFTVAAMLLVNNPGDWGHLYGPLEHAPWDGWTFTDWIFPFFVFISGISMTISLGRLAAQGANRQVLLTRTVRRGLTIIAIGIALNLFPHFNFHTVRIPGVLQRLGLCTVLTAPLVLYFGWRGQLAWIVGLLGAYAVAMLNATVPDATGVMHTGSLVKGEDLGAFIDRTLLGGHLWVQAKTWDPEGLLSTLPAVASQLFGVLAGHWLASKREPMEKAMWLLVAGLALLWIGQVGDAWLMPINKNLWTPSFSVFMAGWACIVFGVFYWLLDAMPLPLLREKAARLLKPCVVFGMNALFIFALSGLIARILGLVKFESGETLKGLLWAPIRDSGLAPVNASLVYAIGFVLAMYVIAWFMWKKRWFVKV
ncbi:acyltransferase family protein [Pelomonas sp. KK5]|uniref:acyltransferase family protein n=1 Tax=Pelomonas sp. KK5 TaxID=1855730 RepID=UPI001E450EE2|nr:heparan-alpha-glucosaminide N-acetyltransferase domain-containing protein [Pelomonas sp. KK5]